MKIFVLYDKAGIHSGRLLGQYLIRKLQGKAEVQRGRPARLAVLTKSRRKFDHIINIGWFRDFNSGRAVVLNQAKAVAASSNKRNARINFKKKMVPAPKLWLSHEKIPKDDYPVIGRTTHHTKGRGLWFCKTPREARKAGIAGATHFLKFIPNTREFRVHVMASDKNLEGLSLGDYLVIKLSEKLPKPGSKPNEVVKSHNNGWIFSYPKDRKDPMLTCVRETARKALSSFDLHWGAVDIMISKDTGKPYVLEINSTPCLTDDQANTLEKYGNNICNLIGLGELIKPSGKKQEKKISQPKNKTKEKRTPKMNKLNLRSFLTRHKY